MDSKTLPARETLDAAELAALTGFSWQHIYRAAQRGDLPCLRLGARIVFERGPVFDALRTIAKRSSKTSSAGPKASRSRRSSSGSSSTSSSSES